MSHSRLTLEEAMFLPEPYRTQVMTQLGMFKGDKGRPKTKTDKTLSKIKKNKDESFLISTLKFKDGEQIKEDEVF